MNTTSSPLTPINPQEVEAVRLLLKTMRATQRRLGTLEFNWAFEVRRQGREVLGTLTRIPGHILDPEELGPDMPASNKPGRADEA